MAKTITTYLVEDDVKTEIRVLRAMEDKNVSDFLRLLIDTYKQSRVQNEVPVLETKEEV